MNTTAIAERNWQATMAEGWQEFIEVLAPELSTSGNFSLAAELLPYGRNLEDIYRAMVNMTFHESNWNNVMSFLYDMNEILFDDFRDLARMNVSHFNYENDFQDDFYYFLMDDAESRDQERDGIAMVGAFMNALYALNNMFDIELLIKADHFVTSDAFPDAMRRLAQHLKDAN
jgi:hypothetical protein